MRLHQLTVSAFGPFADTQEVDFDELNEAGLFLLTGPTGAGKSSLLDAVCFALYGTVPGARGTKTLKSQHAPVEAPPEVVLDFSVRGRRFVVRRRPEWSRPKRRGEGLLTEKASASITETTGGTEHFLSSRAAEVGVLVTDLMGMSASQFVQVALLPQGLFQTFLRASSQERHDVLQQLFQTDRFGRIEEWVHEHSRSLKERAGDGQSSVQRILDTVAERCGTTTPDELCGAQLAPAAADGRVLPWVDGLLAEARSAADAAADAHHRACEDHDRARERRKVAERRQELRARQRAALRVLEETRAGELEAEAARRALDADERATRCRPLLDLVDEAAARRADAERVHGSALQAFSAPDDHDPDHDPDLDYDLDGVPSTAQLDALADALRTRTARLEALLPRERAGAAARRERDAAVRRLADADRAVADTTARADAIPAELAALTRAHADAAARAARREALTDALERARTEQAAAVRLVEVDRVVAALEERHRTARDQAQDARDRVQDLVGRRLAGMAAELAGALTAGAACQVCGSTEHPSPALPARDAVTEADQEAAERALADAADRRDAIADELEQARHRRQALRTASSGLSPADGAERVADLTGQLSEAVRAGGDRDRLDARLQALHVEQTEISARRAEAAATVAALAEAVAGHDAVIATIEAEIAEAVGSAGRSVRGRLAELLTSSRLLAAAQRASAELDAATSRVEEALTRSRRTSAEHGFDDLETVREVLLPHGERERLTSWLREREHAVRQARSILEETEIAALPRPGAGEVDASQADGEELTSAAEAETSTEQAAAVAARDRHHHEERAEALTTQRARLLSALEDWSPVRDQSLRAESMSRLVRGVGHDNQLQMRLSAYVLATRLDQVVAAANERLGQLRDQRYLLQRTGRVARRGSQAGLGLEVVDQWTGDARDPATLSGGETFVVSLSLALGLADVVTQEAGGTEVETLFVDEGFGTLDADTLDDVMDRLDGLRAGGRTVGVVSHVSELRNRIPTQVHVHKTRSGSSVAVRTLVG